MTRSVDSRWATTRYLLGQFLPFTLLVWLGVVAVVAVLTVAYSFRAEITRSGWEIAMQVARWFAAADVALLINRGERGMTYVMTDLIGINGGRAADVLRARGFRVAVVGDHPYPGVPPGIVLRQNPQAGFQNSPGETISLEISR